MFIALALTAAVNATTLTHIDITINGTLPPSLHSRIESLVQSAAGGPFTEQRVESLLGVMLNVLSDHGYHHAALIPRRFTGTHDSLSFALEITPGAPLRIARWELAGLVRTDSSWLARTLSLPTGGIASADAFAHARRQIAAIGGLVPDGSPILRALSDSTVAVVLPIREDPPARFEGALATGSVDGGASELQGRLSVGIRSLFRRDRALQLLYERPRADERLVQLDLADRYALFHAADLAIGLEDWQRVDRRQQAQWRAGLRLSRASSLVWTLQGRWIRITPAQSDVDPARVYESAAGLIWGHLDRAHLQTALVYSLHRRWLPPASQPASESRLRLETSGRLDLTFGAPTLTLAAGARQWGRGATLRSGDEWFLGGEILRGYTSRSLAAADGLWLRCELSQPVTRGLDATVFAEQAWLAMFDGPYHRPSSAGCALWLESGGRRGRLELAWRDHAAWRDGLLRLVLTQGW
ncbi:MAG TPA: hypothetical protein VNN55_00665 [bacterium]|nr:hypothetical protein [bacterium]